MAEASVARLDPRRARSIETICAALRAAGTQGLHILGVSRATAISEKSAKEILLDAKRRGLVRVCDFRFVGRRRVACYGLGSQPDAVRTPLPKSRAARAIVPRLDIAATWITPSHQEHA